MYFQRTKGKGVGLFYLLWLCNKLYPKTYGGKRPFIMLMESLGQEFEQSQWRWLLSAPWRLVPPLKSFRSGNWKRLSLGSKDRSHMSCSAGWCWLLSKDASVPHHVTFPRCPTSGFLTAGWQGECQASVTREEEPERNHITFYDLATEVTQHYFHFVLLALVVPKPPQGQEEGESTHLLMESGKMLEEHIGSIAVAGFGKGSL